MQEKDFAGTRPQKLRLEYGIARLPVTNRNIDSQDIGFECRKT